MGSGFGPSEVNLPLGLESDLEARQLMIGQRTGSGGSVIFDPPGRYGSAENTRRFKNGGGPVPGQGYIDDNNLGQDLFSAYKLFGYPFVGANPGGVLGGFFQSSPMDIYGRFQTDFPAVFDPFAPGFPISMPVIDIAETSLFNSEIINNPYEVNFSGTPENGSFYDRLFTLHELEQVYRAGDIDLVGDSPGRLRTLAPTRFDDSQPAANRGPNRLLTTTDSWEVPASFGEFLDPGTGRQFETLMTKLYAVLSRPPNAGFGVPDSGDPVLREQLIMANLSGFFPEANQTFSLDRFGQTPLLPRAMLSEEIRSGRPFNVNRPFGDGLDDFNNQNDGVVDNPGEVDRLGLPTYGVVGFDHDNDSVVANTPAFFDAQSARQLFARQLYVLALLVTELVDRNGDGDVTNDNFTAFGGDRLAYRRVIAQWAINVADFRDPDSIMTPFEVRSEPLRRLGCGWRFDTNEAQTGALPPQFYLACLGSRTTRAADHRNHRHA